MFSRFISLLVLVAPLASALTLNTPANVFVGERININWTLAAGDPSSFSIELLNQGVITEFAIANTVDASLNGVSVQIPTVPLVSGYTIEAVDIGNITHVFATSGSFAIGEAVSSGSSSITVSATATATGTTTTNALSSVSLSANSLPAASSTSPSGISSSLTGTGTGTSTGTSASVSPSTAAALSTRLALTNTCGYAVLLLSAVAGAAVVAL